MLELARLLTPETDLQSTYQGPDGIVRFVRKVLRVEEIADYQEDVLRRFVTNKRIAVRAPHGAGKTALSAWVVLWGIATFGTDVKVVTTASAWRQLTHYTWPEIRKWAVRGDWSDTMIRLRRGKELLERNIKVGDKEAFAVASNNPAFIEGAHATVLIYVFDEAKAIPDATWDAAEGAFSTDGNQSNAEAYALAISTPGQTSGRFYQICRRGKGLEDWDNRHITAEECIRAGRMGRDWFNARKLQWGEQSAVFKNRALGEFDDTADENLIALAWVEAAHKRWYEWVESNGQDAVVRGECSYGVDPAYKGLDSTTVAQLWKRVLVKVDQFQKQDTMKTAGFVAANVTKDRPVAIDNIGVGAGVFDRLRELGFRRAYGVNVAESAKDHRGNPLHDSTGQYEFVNLRAYVWWMMREALDPLGEDPIAIPPIDELTDDLTSPLWWYRSDGKIQVESKDDIRAKNGRSTDFADALGLALYAARTRPLMMVG